MSASSSLSVVSSFSALSDGFLAKLVGQHFITPIIESVNAKYDPTWPSSASFIALLMDTALSLHVIVMHIIHACNKPEINLPNT